MPSSRCNFAKAVGLVWASVDAEEAPATDLKAVLPKLACLAELISVVIALLLLLLSFCSVLFCSVDNREWEKHKKWVTVGRYGRSETRLDLVRRKSKERWSKSPFSRSSFLNPRRTYLKACFNRCWLGLTSKTLWDVNQANRQTNRWSVVWPFRFRLGRRPLVKLSFVENFYFRWTRRFGWWRRH